MSSPEDPTRRLPPAEPPVAREREVFVEDDGGWRHDILDRLDALRNWLIAVGLIALVALGLSAYALLTAEEEDDARGGASREQVRTLEDRVDELDSRTEDLPSERAVNDLRDDQQQTADRVEALERQAEDRGDTQELEQAIDDLSRQIEELDQRVREVEQRQEEQEQQAP